MNNNAKKTLRVLSVATAATMMVGGAAFAVNADDIHGHWAEKTLQQFIDNGWIQGDEGGIRPDSTITRAEMATVVDAVECKHVRSVYSRLALLIAYAHYIILLNSLTLRF